MPEAPQARSSSVADPNEAPASLRASRMSAVAVLVMLTASATALLLAPGLIPESYNWVAHSTSESGAQGIKGAWMARLGFLLFGFAVLLLIWPARKRWGSWGRVLHGSFGVMMICAAAFAARPWDKSLPFDAIEDLFHSVAAFVMGVAFALGVVAVMLRRPVEHVARRLFDWVAIAAAPLIPLAMMTWPERTGLLQRVMFAIAFVWYGAEAVDSIRAINRVTRGPVGPRA